MNLLSPVFSVHQKGNDFEPRSFFCKASPEVSEKPFVKLKTFCRLVFLLVLNFKNMTNTNPKLLKLNQDHTSKDRFFWSNPYKIEVMINSLIKMLELQNFGHMTTSAI